MNGKWNLSAGQKREHVAILLLSSGGGWGAYCAGFLSSWSHRTLDMPRPRFDVVTGVSTGAIIAAFALLGPDYDPALEQRYRGVTSDDLFGGCSVFTLPFWNSLNDPGQLESTSSNRSASASSRVLARQWPPDAVCGWARSISTAANSANST